MLASAVPTLSTQLQCEVGGVRLSSHEQDRTAGAACFVPAPTSSGLPRLSDPQRPSDRAGLNRWQFQKAM